MMGRPSKYSRELAARICERISTTELGLEQVLAEIREQDGEAPTSTSVYRWLEKHQSFREQSARARRMQAELLHDRAQIAAQQPLIGKIVTEGGKDGTITKTCDNVERSKLIVQTLLKRAGQLDPKKYGEKTQLTGDGGGPIETKVSFEIVGKGPG